MSKNCKLNKYIKESLVFLIFSFLILFYTSNNLLLPHPPEGEMAQYMLPTIALEQHFTDDIRKSDLQLAFKQYPELSGHWQAWINIGGGPFKHNGKFYTYYFPTYAILCLPFVWLFRIFGFSQTYAFPMANIFYFILALLTVLKLPLSFRLKIITILILGFSPLICYLHWASGEVLIASLLICALTALFCENYRLSMLSYALAATINITISPFCLYIYFYVFMKNFKGAFSVNSIIYHIRENLGLFPQLFLINLIAMIPPTLNLIRYNMFTPITGGSLANILGRMWAYLTDLNMGILPYFPFFIFIVIFTLISSRFRFQYLVFLFIAGITFFGFSLMVHIACGMAGIARYLTWTMSLIIVGTIYFSSFIYNKIIYFTNYICLLLTFIWSTIVVMNYGHLNTRSPYLYSLDFQPIAKYVLYNFPQFYNPYPTIFYEKVIHSEQLNWYHYKNNTLQIPIIYKNAQNQLIKILCPPQFAPCFQNNIEVSRDYRNTFESEIKKIQSQNKMGYLNFPPNAKAQLFDFYSFGKFGAENQYLKQGFDQIELYGVWSTGDKSVLKVPVQKTGVNTLLLIVKPFISGKEDERRISVSVNDKFTKQFNLHSSTVQELHVPIENIGHTAEITIATENPDSPKNAGQSDDDRMLGVFLYAASIY